MKRILLMLEDYNELLYIETLLKKLGFDAMSTQKVKGIYDLLMSFRPSVVVISETIKDQKGIDVLVSLKADKPDILGMVLLNSGSRQPAAGAEAFIPRPINLLVILKILGQWVGLDEDRLLEKIDKLGLFKFEKESTGVRIFKGGRDGSDPNGNQIVYRPQGGDATPGAGIKFFNQTPEQASARSKRFLNAVKNLPIPVCDKVEKKNVVKEVKEFRERTNDPELVNIDKERKEFVDALYFKKKKRS